MNKILTREQEKHYMRQPLPKYRPTYNPDLQGRLNLAREKKSLSMVIDALLDYASSNGGMSGVKPETFYWLKEVRRDSTI